MRGFYSCNNSILWCAERKWDMRTILDVNLTFINNQKVKRKREMEKMSPDFGSIWELGLRDIMFEGWFVGCKTKIKEYFPLFCNKLFEISNTFYSYKVLSSNISLNINALVQIQRTFETYVVFFVSNYIFRYDWIKYLPIFEKICKGKRKTNVVK